MGTFFAGTVTDFSAVPAFPRSRVPEGVSSGTAAKLEEEEESSAAMRCEISRHAGRSNRIGTSRAGRNRTSTHRGQTCSTIGTRSTGVSFSIGLNPYTGDRLSPTAFYNWPYDSGASEVIRPPEMRSLIGDSVSNPNVPVDIPGGLSLTAQTLRPGEVILDGTPLMSMGRTVQTGGWAVLWTPEKEVVVARITPEMQEHLHAIVSEGTDVVFPKVDGVTPVLTDEQAQVFRHVLDRRGSGYVNPEAVRQSVFQATCTGNNGLILGTHCTHFDQSCTVVPSLAEEAHRLVRARNVFTETAAGLWDQLVVRAPQLDPLGRGVEFVRRLESIEHLINPRPEVGSVALTRTSAQLVEFGDVTTRPFLAGRDHDWANLDAGEVTSDDARPHQAHNIHIDETNPVDFNHNPTPCPADPSCEVCRQAKPPAARFQRDGAADDKRSRPRPVSSETGPLTRMIHASKVVTT